LVGALFALLASERVHTSMRDYGQDALVYLEPFDATVTVDRELRVFVCAGGVSAMSQYSIFSPSVFSGMGDADLATVARRVDAFHRDSVLPRWTAAGGVASYVMDVEYVADVSEPVRLIELNSFGAELAAGSALFHWLRDAKELYSSSRLCIRVLSDDNGLRN
jgi:hypothetical protein